MGIRSRLYDAKGSDSEIRLTAAVVRKLNDEKLLWVDVEQPGPADLGTSSRTAHILTAVDILAP